MSYFYQRFIEVYGIPILGSKKTTLASLKRACYILKFILAEQVKLRQNLYNKEFRIVIVSSGESITSLPEFSRSNLQTNRNIVALNQVPVVAIGEELVICDKTR